MTIFTDYLKGIQRDINRVSSEQLDQSTREALIGSLVARVLGTLVTVLCFAGAVHQFAAFGATLSLKHLALFILQMGCSVFGRDLVKMGQNKSNDLRNATIAQLREKWDELRARMTDQPLLDPVFRDTWMIGPCCIFALSKKS